MTETVKLSTQGISDDWMSANGDFDTKFRGALKRDGVLSALVHLSPLELPEGAECPPHVLIETDEGPITFIGQGGAIECLDAKVDVEAEQGVALAFGEITMVSLAEAAAKDEPATAPPPPAMAPPPPVAKSKPVKRPKDARPVKPRPTASAAPRQHSKAFKVAGVLGAVLGAAMGGGMVGGTDSAAVAATGIAPGAAVSENSQIPAGMRRKNTWRQWVLYVIAAPFLFFAVIALIGIFAAPNSDGKLGAVVGFLGSGFIGLGIFYAARKQRPWVDSDGNMLTGVMMADMFAAADMSDDFSDDGGVDFD
jgi:hypothetical protein